MQILSFEQFNQISESKIEERKFLRNAAIATALTTGALSSDAQCSGDLRAAAQNPYDKNNAKILAGNQDALDKRINKDNGLPGDWKMFPDKQSKREYEKSLRDQKRDDDKYKSSVSKSFKHKFDPDLNLQEEPLTRVERASFKGNFNNFIKQNPGFKIDPSRYTVEERYAFLSKVIKEQSTVRRLNVLFGRSNPYDNIRMTIEEIYELIKDPKINGFDNFTEMYRNDFPGIAFPDNPHKFD